jgi:alanyl-tRNA synthetase
MTELMYIEYPDLFESSAQVTNYGEDSKGVYLVLNQTIFYPQGGGQPADQGEIIAKNAAYKIFDVRNVDGEIRHYIIDINQIIDSGCGVTIRVDKDRRIVNSKYHTAGHLIAAVVEKINQKLKATKGHQFPGEAYVEFDGNISNSDDFLTKITSNMQGVITKNATIKIEELSPNDMITKDLPYELPKDKPLRVCHIAGFSPVPCGGTHVKTLEDIALLEIKKCKSKKGKTKIYYEVK